MRIHKYARNIKPGDQLVLYRRTPLEIRKVEKVERWKTCVLIYVEGRARPFIGKPDMIFLLETAPRRILPSKLAE